MSTLSEQAAKAIKDATGWDVTDVLTQGAEIRRPNGIILGVWWSVGSGWECMIRPLGWMGTGPTPEAAIAAVLPRYRAHIAALAADVLPGWPRLEWQAGSGAPVHLNLHVGTKVYRVLTVTPGASSWSVAQTTWGLNDYGYYHERTAVLERAELWVAEMGFPCPLPPFPGASNAS
jgi:hypothetical protein